MAAVETQTVLQFELTAVLTIVVMGRSKKGQNQKNTGKKNAKNKLGFARAEHLHRCALFLSHLGSKPNDGFSKTSRHISKLCRQVMDTEMVQLEREQKQQFCKNCREVLVGSYPKSELMIKQRGSITEKCGKCHKERNYMTKDGYGKLLKDRMDQEKKALDDNVRPSE